MHPHPPPICFTPRHQEPIMTWIVNGLPFISTVHSTYSVALPSAMLMSTLPYGWLSLSEYSV
jgi:hypothetical protein